ncbi:antirestriction protein [Clostridioides difficile]|uniref:antirestriction protein ArdA n=1 Tax=Clostridioides difficile TaxID=1496 RepID=UPI000D1FB09D|nr:antirestriction protein ArdA [Clostridioides difficile]VFC57224.1 antirestriction protein [Clostridioides difficile]VHX76050.1 antirestriction protein [Clostridioides difficile]VIG07823.1 antirestriction protein [Clostridioides difficile]HBE9445502.1 antirestriction protein ArdA [Clostridioides difficile]
MEEMRVYIANLGKYNEGELVGNWFTPPIDWDNLKERIGLNSEYEEYAIHDWELPFEISEYTSIDEINRLCSMAEELASTDIGEAISDIKKAFFSSFEELYEHKEDIVYYPGCSDMSDECNMLGEIPENVRNYINYEAYARDLEINYSFVVTNHGVFEYAN